MKILEGEECRVSVEDNRVTIKASGDVLAQVKIKTPKAFLKLGNYFVMTEIDFACKITRDLYMTLLISEGLATPQAVYRALDIAKLETTQDRTDDFKLQSV